MKLIHKSAEKPIKRVIFGINIRDRVTNIELKRRTKTTDVARIVRLKWQCQWAGHIALQI